jgi:hypothetical protein
MSGVSQDLAGRSDTEFRQKFSQSFDPKNIKSVGFRNKAILAASETMGE